MIKHLLPEVILAEIDDLLGCRSTLFNVKRADLLAVRPVGVSSNIRRTADNANELEVEHNTSQIFVDETDGPVGLILGECSCHFGSLLKTRKCKIGEYVIESTRPSTTSDELTTQST